MNNNIQDPGKWFPRVVLSSGISVAVVVAFFSVTGIASLYQGSYYSVLIMAIVLEFAKLVSVTYIKREWNYVNNLIRILFIGVITVLMALTSVGVYGYLTTSYQKSAIVLEKIYNDMERVNYDIDIAKDRLNLALGDKKNAIDNRQTELNGMTFDDKTKYLDKKRRS